ncbi:KTSC domain-containing protein [Pontibacillus litoralis]|uniref:KTSC domain-containing protein n=1 Tax=Pontibacillus litoralis JSM 072002 TaxID=1385512 RepID=A0A0A5GDJ5_9BACI|nr:KTSC domain-containing protein [Pontibacillus litoralis]KGX89195.1 hypothetical protein N784_01075 [Pontibacillus litoralis JSM 072002]
MNWTTFQREMWNLRSFETIGYDHDREILVIYYLDGSIVEFLSVEQQRVFELIVSSNKENNAKKLYTHYSFNMYTYAGLLYKIV